MNTVRNERSSYQDPLTELTVTQWTQHRSNHLYFTNPGWFDSNKQLAFISDINGVSQLASLDLRTGDQRLLSAYQEGINSVQAAIDPHHNQAVVWTMKGNQDSLELIDCTSGEHKELFRLPPVTPVLSQTLPRMANGFAGMYKKGKEGGLEERLIRITMRQYLPSTYLLAR